MYAKNVVYFCLNMHKYTVAQLPHVENENRMLNNCGVRNEDIINNAVNQYSYRPVLPNSSERSHYFVKPERNPLVPGHPLDRYSSGGYYDPCWESLENDRLQFHASLPASIISGLKNKSKYNVVIDALSNEDLYKDDAELEVGKNDRSGIHAYKLNDTVGGGFDRTFNGLHEEKRYAINDTHGTGSLAYAHKLNDPCYDDVPIHNNFLHKPPRYESNDPVFHYSSDNIRRPVNVESSGEETIGLVDVPLYPEIYPYVQREGVDGRFRSRNPAGKSFSSIETQKQIENFSIVPCKPEDNANICAILTEKECKDIDRMLRGDYCSTNDCNDKRLYQSNTRGANKSFGKEGFANNTTFENPIAKEADYMYMSALKVRANAVCEYLRNNKSYNNWSDNWKLLKSNLKSGRLFERLSETDADIAYVINKGDQVKFRIRDKSRYVPINTYQYVLYHEMAHMSTRELQHTPTFMKLLNIISLAGFECGFIDFRKLPNDYYITNGSPILCRQSMKEEVCSGAEWLKQANLQSARYYDGIISAVEHA